MSDHATRVRPHLGDAEGAARADHHFWADDLDIAATLAAQPELASHKQLTDAHLIALARRRGGRLATFDRPLHGTADVKAIP